MTSKIVSLGLGVSIGVNIVLAWEVRRLRSAVRDTTRRIGYLGRVLNSHAAGNQHREDQRLP